MKIRKILCLFLSAAVLFGSMRCSPYEVYGDEADNIPLYNTGELIEAEDGYIQNYNFEIRDSIMASGKKCVVISHSGRMDNPSADVSPLISYRINIPKPGNYCLILRYNAADTGKDSFYARYDGGEYIYQGVEENGSKWGWTTAWSAISIKEAGVYTLDILNREPSLIIDCFFVVEYDGKEDPAKQVDRESVEQTILNNRIDSPEFAKNSTAKTFELKDGFALFEAEDVTYSSKAYTVSSRLANQSSGTCLTPSIVCMDKPDRNAEGLEFNFNADVTSRVYYVWARVQIADGGSDSAWMSCDGELYSLAMNFSKTGAEYEWRLVAAYTGIYAGTKHNFRLYPREGGNNIDMFFITNSALICPSGKGEIGEFALPEDKYPAAPIKPEQGQHPRLYFTAADIDTIKTNMDKAQNSKARAEFRKLLETDTDGRLGQGVLESYTNYNAKVMAAIEAYAFQYAVYGSVSYGQKAKNAILNFAQTMSFDPSTGNLTRYIGHSIFLCAEVYDWCYDLFTEDERRVIIDNCESAAMMMETGYPPEQQGAVCGHGGEAQLLRDMLGLGIAVYDERPDIYNFVGGRIFSEFIEPRNYWYQSATHHQGDSYGQYRYYWEVIAQAMIYRMTGGDGGGGVKIFNDTQADVPYFWIYTRRPDGQIFRTGDCYNESISRGVYWTGGSDLMFLSSNFYGDAVLKGEYNTENPNDSFIYNDTGASPVLYLLFNDPDLTGQTDKSSLPLTRYFGSPNGMMIARTGWDVNVSSPSQSSSVVAMMKIGERWGANHHHLDAGNFQLYYKGILASEQGFYDEYGTYHDQNYNKASVAHNVLTIYDPDEKFTPWSGKNPAGNDVVFAGGVNDGGQRRPGGEPATMEAWMDDAYETGVVLDHAFGPDENAPEYTYIKGDITKAYSSKVSNVTRAMAFMPLDDENYPAVMVIMDKVTSANASFKKKWLLHSQQEPEINGNTTIINRDTDGYNGKLTVQTLLPENASVTKIGGEGKQFWIGNQAGDFENDGYNFGLKSTPGSATALEAGWGRVEVSPSHNNLSDTFLNVLAVSDADNPVQPLDSKLIRGQKLIGVQTAGKALLFADTDAPVTDKNRINDTASFVITGDNELDILIMGVKAGEWAVSANGRTKIYIADEDGGTIYFKGEAGEYVMTYGGASTYGASVSGTVETNEDGCYIVRASLSGEYAGGCVIAAAYDEEGAVVSVKKQVCGSDCDYSFAFSEDDVKNLSKFKLFLWNGSIIGVPIASRREVLPE